MEIICSNCKKPNVSYASFCANCGTKLAQPQPGTQLPPIPQQYSPGTPPVSPGKHGFIIGRAPDCDIVLHDDSVSSRHARIFLDNGNVILEDTGSRNGVFVNGKKITGGAILLPEDNVVLGHALLNLSHPLIISLFSRSPAPRGVVSPYQPAAAGLGNFSFNKNFIGKILYAILIALIFLPWLKVDLGESYASWFFKDTKLTVSAFQFAFNIPVSSDEDTRVSYDKDMPFPAHTLCLILFILLIIGFAMNFINLRISRQFNVINIVSIVIFSVTMSYVYLFKNNNDKSFVDLAILGYAVYIFCIICFISIFEGLIEYLISRLRKK